MKTLRNDQKQAISDIRDALIETKRVVMQGPTGSGKTVLIADIVTRAVARSKKVLITVPAISLVDQTVIAINAQGINDIGVIQASHPMTDWSRPIQVASIQTLQHRWREGKMPQADLVLVDEVHRMFEVFSKWIPDPKWLKVPFIGFSATPWARGLGVLYDKLVNGSTIKSLTDDKVLVPFKTFAPDAPDLSGVRITAGEFNAADLEEIMRPNKLVANIVATWKDMAQGRPTVAFCCSRAHAEQLAKEFEEAGIGAAFMDCETPLPDRYTIRNRMLRGEIEVVCNVDVVGLGVDWPEVSCIIYARPTMSDMRFVQNIGRGLRAAPGKQDLLILDHSTTTQRLGFVDEIYGYHGRLDDAKPKPKAEVGVALPKECPSCHLLKPARVAVCPHCGHKVDEHLKPVLVERGTLREFKASDTMAELRKQLPDKPHCFGQLYWYARDKGYKPGWAAVKVKEIFGSFPKAREPDEDTISAPVAELLTYIYTSTEKWKKQNYYAKRNAAKTRNGHAHNGHANGHDHGALSDREQALVDRVSQQARDGLMSEQDYEDFK